MTPFMYLPEFDMQGAGLTNGRLRVVLGNRCEYSSLWRTAKYAFWRTKELK
jgi:hypothetical protein